MTDVERFLRLVGLVEEHNQIPTSGSVGRSAHAEAATQIELPSLDGVFAKAYALGYHEGQKASRQEVGCTRLAKDLTLARNQLGNAVGAIIDSGGYCEGPHDVAAAIYRLTEQRDGLRALIVQMLPHVATVASAASASYLDRKRPDDTVWDAVNPRVSQVRSALALLPQIAPYDVDPLEGEGLDVDCRYCWAYGYNGRGSDPNERAHGDGCVWEAARAVGGAPGVSETHTDPKEEPQ